jgi:hypothetical protein
MAIGSPDATRRQFLFGLGAGLIIGGGGTAGYKMLKPLAAAPPLAGQHAPPPLPNGDILIFDNGPFRVEAALLGLEMQRRPLDTHILEVRSRLSRGNGHRRAATKNGHRISAVGRRRIAAAQKRRWA